MKYSYALPVFLAVLLGMEAAFVNRARAFEKPSHETLPNFDRRKEAARQEKPVPADKAAAAAQLKALVPGVRIEAGDLPGTPIHIASPRSFLSGPKGQGKGILARAAQAFAPDDPHQAIKSFLMEYKVLLGHGPEVLDRARLKRQFVTPHNGLQTFVWEQHVDDIPVFEAVLLEHVTPAGELVSVSSQFVADPDKAADAGQPDRVAAEAAPKISAREALVRSAKIIGEELRSDGLEPVEAGPAGKVKRQRFKGARLIGEPEARLVWVPMTAGELRLCWRVEVKRRKGGETFLVLIDAQTGEAVLRRCLTVYRSDASFRVYSSDSPSPLTPAYPAPSTNQPPVVPRVLKTLAGLSPDASPTGWITDAENETRGNNVDAHLDRDADDRPDLPRPQGLPFRVFDFPLDLNDSPYSYGDAAVVNLFYWCNWMHDKLYELGFTEAAGNFQKDNFGRGGLGDDPLLVDAQDGSGFNNANYAPSEDGTSPRIQMYVFNGPDPYRDGDLDAEIILHEYTHGLSDRLIGGGVGIYELQTLGLGEGWSDFYALALLSESGDDVDGVYPAGGYATWQFRRLTQNYYYGIRRYPYSTDLLKNPLTLRDIDPGQADPHNGVPLSPIRVFDPSRADEVHNQGEVWCSALWEARANLIRKHGFEVGNPLILRLVTDGLKLSPPNPTFLQARDAILQADRVNTGGLNQNELWRAFAKRGLGVNAASPPSWSTAGVRESFDLPDFLSISPLAPLVFSTSPNGPASRACRSFALTNTSSAALSWVLAQSASWFEASPLGGVMAPGDVAEVKVCLNLEASLRPLGTYFESVTFSNATSGVTQGRAVQLNVVNFAAMPFQEGFEDLSLQSYWSMTGTGTHRFRVSTNDAPHGGAGELILDSEVTGYYSRNEATLGLDLAGWTNVVLRFWARQFKDEPDGPPPIPFIDGADFDGVAISADGVAWHEVRSLLALSDGYTESVVDLDAAVTRFGLSYNSSFRIRFNQYDNGSAPDDGIAIDDIAITGFAPYRFSLVIPEEAVEGDGVLRRAGVMSLPEPTVADLKVTILSSDNSEVLAPAFVIIPAGERSATFDLRILDDTFLDGTTSTTFSVAAPGYVGASAAMVVHDNETALITLLVPKAVREGDGILEDAGRVVLDTAPASDIVVELRSSDPREIQVPSMIVVAKGQTSARFYLRVVDDLKIDQTRAVMITALVPGWLEATNAIQVADNETTALTVNGPGLVGEGSGLLVSAAAIRLSGTLPTNLVVSLTSSDPGRIIVPATAAIAAGQTRANFDITVLDNKVFDDARPVLIFARAPGFTDGSVPVRILDNEVPPVPFSPDPPHFASNNPLQVALSWRLGSAELIMNGGFETGDFTGWQREDSEDGDFVINDGTVIPEGDFEAVEPFAGEFSAVSQQAAPGIHVLYQDVAIPLYVERVVLNWTDRIRNHASEFARDQSFRVEIRDTQNRFIQEAFVSRAGDPLLDGWRERSFDLENFRGRSVRIAFVETDSLGQLNVHLDNIRIMVGFSDVTSSEVYFGTNPSPGSAELQGVTTDRYWELPPLRLQTTYYWRVTTTREGVRVPGPLWTFSTRGLGPVDHFVWSPMAVNQAVNAPFPVSITAKDDLGNTVTNFSGRVLLSGSEEGAGERVQILAFLAQADSASDLRRTEAAIAAHFTNFSATATSVTDVSTLRALLSSKDVFLITSQDQSTLQELDALGAAWGPLLRDFTQEGGVVIACSYSRDEHLTLNNSDLIALTKLGASRTATIVRPAADPWNEAIKTPFTGHYIAQYATTNGQVSLQTSSGNAVVISRDLGAGRAVMIGTDYTTNRTGMDQAIANVVRAVEGGSTRSVPLKPTVSGYFANGVWNGVLTVQNVSRGTILRADDGSGHTGKSQPLTVGASNDLAVSLSDSADPVAVGGSVAYAIVVTNSGPSPVSNVVLTDRLPPGAVLVGVTNQYGAWALSNASVICQLGTLAGGRSAAVGLTILPTRGGRITNTVVVAGSSTEAFLENNEASTVTRVDVPSIFISDPLGEEGNEGTRGMVFRLRLEPASVQTVSCDFATSNIVAMAGRDYVAVAGTIVFPPGVTNQTLTIRVLGDLLNEGQESLAVDLSNPTNAAIADRRGYGVIVDDDPVPSLSIGSAAVLEGEEGVAAELLFPVALSAPSGQIVQVDFATADGTALAASDYIATSGTLAFPPGTTNQTLTVLVIGDRNSEADETLFVNLSAAENANLANLHGQGTIVDDDAGALDHFDWAAVASPQYLDAPFTVALTAKDGLNNTITNFAGPVALSGLNARREFTIGGASNSWSYPMGAYFHDQRLQSIYLADEIGAPAQITSLALFVSVRPGQTLRNWTIRLKHTALSRYTLPTWEAEGWTTVYGKNEIIAGTGWITFHFLTPFDFNGRDHLMVDFSFNNDFYSSDGQCGFTPVSEPRSMFFQTDGGFGDPLRWGTPLSPPAEMAARVPALRFNVERPVSISPSETGRFTKGVWSGSVLAHEMAENVALRASDRRGHTGIANMFTVTAHNDLSVTVSDSPHPVGVGETLTYHVALTNTGPGGATGVVLTDTLPANAHFLSAVASQGSCNLVDGVVLCELGAIPGASMATIELIVRPQAPGPMTNLVEVFRAKKDAYLGNNSALIVTRIAPASLSIEDASVVEGTGGTTQAILRVRLSSPSADEISVGFSTSAKTASNVVDFAASKGRLTFPPGTTNQEISVPVVGDALNELNETFLVRLSNPTNALLAISQAIVTILDDDPPVVAGVNDARAAEGNTGTTALRFNVRLSSPSGQIVYVSYSTSNATAIAGTDYQAAKGILLFPPGFTNRNLNISILGDRVIELDETFVLNLSKPVNATLGRERAVGTILNDDGLSGMLDHFAWSLVPSPQYTNEPFVVSIAAQDFANSIVTNFSGTASLSGRTGDSDISVGGGNVPWGYPFATGYHDARTQVIYLRDELGAARRLVGLTLDAILPPGQSMTRWTIRMKHTSLSSFSTSGWESDGWVTVYQGNEIRDEEGENTFVFTTPFAYDGIQNVMIDFSFNNDYFTTDGWCRAFEAPASRSLSFQTDGGFGDPLSWAGTTAPVPMLNSLVPNLRLLSGFPVPIAPGAAGRFANGLWTGYVSVRWAVSDMILLVDDGSNHRGLSSVFSVFPVRDTDGDGLPDEWEFRYFGSLHAPEGGPDADPDRDGRTNLEEYLSGTDPLDPGNVLRITSVELRGGAIRIRFSTVPGKQYRVEKADDPAQNVWTILTDQISGTGGMVEAKDPTVDRRDARFYRVRLLP